MNRRSVTLAILIAVGAGLPSWSTAQEADRPTRWLSSNLQRFQCDGNKEYPLSSAGFPTFLELDVDARRIGVSATFQGTSLVDSDEPMVLTVSDGVHTVKSSSGFAFDKGPTHDVFDSVSTVLITSGNTHKITIAVTTDHRALDNQSITVTMTCFR
jgi:hypothetical protein